MGTISFDKDHSFNGETAFSKSNHIYKFITECPEHLSNSKDNMNHCNSDNELDLQGESSGIQMMNTPVVNHDTSCAHPPGSKRRLFNDDNHSPIFTQQPFTDEYSSCGKLTRGKQKIPIEFITDRTKRYSTFSKRKTGLMKKAVELAELTGAEVLLLVASETNHVYTFATQRLKGIIELECGKKLIQTCLSSSVSTDNSFMKNDYQDSKISSSNQNEMEWNSCKKENNIVTNSNKHKDCIAESLCIRDEDSTTVPVLKVETSPQISNQIPINKLDNHDDNFLSSTNNSSQGDDHISLDNETVGSHLSEINNISNSVDSNNMLCVPLSVFPSSTSQNVFTLTPLSSSLFLTAQITTNQLFLVPQINSMSYIQSDSTNVSNNLSISNQSNSNFIEFQNNNPSNKESLEFPTDCTIKESIFLKSDSNENLINKLGDNSCKHYFRPAD